MQLFRRFALPFLLVVFPCLAQAQAPDPAPSTPVETAELPAFEPTREEAVLEGYVDGVVGAHMRKFKTPGVIVSVVRDGKVLFAKGYGAANIETSTPADGETTLFRIGSISKTFVWTAVMMLAERGALDLDRDVNDYLQDLAIPEKFGAPVTLNHLMAHRAGFEDAFGVFMYADDGETTLTEALKNDMPERVFPPGARTSYSNWGAALAAKVVEDVSGVSFERFLKDEILTPLAMENTALKGPAIMGERLRARTSIGYDVASGAPVANAPMEIGPYAPAGAISSTAADMAKWMLLLLGGGEHEGVRLYSGKTAGLMWERAYDDRAASGGLAHGFMTKPYRGYDLYGHGGGTLSFRSYMQLAPALNLGIFVSQNAATDGSLATQLPDLILDHLAPEGGSYRSSVTDAAEIAADEFAGVFITNRRSFSRFEKINGAGGMASVAPGTEGSLIITSPSGANEFFPLSGARDVFENRAGNRVQFGRDDGGRVTHFSDAVHSYERVSIFSNPILFNGAVSFAALLSLTTLLGAWRRQAAPTPKNQTAMGRRLGWFSLASAVAVVGLIILFGMSAVQMASLTTDKLVNYPPLAISLLRVFALFVFAICTLALLSLIPAWRQSGWSLWRKAHHSMFALSLAFLAVMLVAWRVVFAPIA